jgi:hypothetical protein
MSAIVVENIGPIEKLHIPYPENGGIVVLRARNGRGKTKALEAIESLSSGGGKVPVRDGALSGRVEGFGAKLSVARSTRRSGELEVVTLEGRLNAADLVDPGIANPEAADARRIRALIQTAGIEADLSLFYPLLGGQATFEAICSKAIKPDQDPVELAARIKREVEAAARIAESQADTQTGHARAHREAAGELDLTAEADTSVLQAALEQSIRHQTGLEERSNSALIAAQNALQARSQLTEVQAQGLLNLSDAESRFDAAITAREAAKAAVDEAARALRQAEETERLAEKNCCAALEGRRAAEGQHRLVAGWEAAIETAARVSAPTENELTAARDAVESARRGVERGALIREARKRIGMAETCEQEAAAQSDRARLLRDAARGTDEVLSAMVAKLGTPLRVEAGRLVLKTGRGDTYFGELSHGERWKLAIDLCVDQVGAAGLLVMPQEAFEALDPINREEIAEHARSRGVLIMTAEASEDDAIIAEVYA